MNNELITLTLTTEQLIEVTTGLAAARRHYECQAACVANGHSEMLVYQASAWRLVEREIWRQKRGKTEGKTRKVNGKAMYLFAKWRGEGKRHTYLMEVSHTDIYLIIALPCKQPEYTIIDRSEAAALLWRYRREIVDSNRARKAAKQ